jgi:hypothetical protein
MPITYPLDLPDTPGFIEFEWDPTSAVARQINPFDLTRKIYVWEGQIRLASVKVQAMPLAAAKKWMAFIHKLNGIQGTFYMQDEVAAAVRGSYVPSGSYHPEVDGANQTGCDLVTKGWPPSITKMLLAGDWIAINNRLYQLLDDVNSGGGGAATLTVWPNVGGIAANTAIDVGSDAYGIFRLTDWPKFPWSEDWFMTGFAFGAEEAIPYP